MKFALALFFIALLITSVVGDAHDAAEDKLEKAKKGKRFVRSPFFGLLGYGGLHWGPGLYGYGLGHGYGYGLGGLYG